MLQMAPDPRFNRLHIRISDVCLRRALLFSAVDGTIAGKTTQTQAIETNHLKM
ncbi:hypothetical protein F3P66_19180 [Agrobacterium fabrum]|uniref:Uncharacterized protein n=1 Tax=Agrobacterium fabrum (strain C58 / ATCC 33970) TaxID=176299 RepID=Q8U909_AGRFC|nr:hypothetical protein [Agrobacterium fabrum]AAL44729.1 hypothetical protein Atu3921 [Agrobacterium fabrum str. C58]NMV71280.1 hypothetical protein [Agrobacterium fabrum]QQN08028.1 hypothetical protein EML4058_18280 [Agrobacterium fabrum]QRM61533.1 hypothetical protein F3P66_19180 [Agrobacterium fabrum]TRB27422.1 hypothetical protein EXN51_19995 [Agrobacterium fabrum]